MNTENTALLGLPYLMPSQAQKHVTHNEALRMIDAILHIKVEDSGRLEPPADPAEGQRHALGSEPTGAFAGQAGRIAAFQDGAWSFHEPKAGWVIWVAASATLRVHDGAGWVAAAPSPSIMPMLGLNTGADTTNRLAVASPATLLTHDGEGHQLKINKAAVAATGSLLFQTAWSGRAEMGLAGSDDFSIKVSADAALWNTALVADGATGNISVPGRLGVGIQAPHASAYMEIASTSRGLLPPRMNTAQRDAIASPAEGLMIYNINTHRPEFWNGTAWAAMSGT